MGLQRVQSHCGTREWNDRGTRIRSERQLSFLQPDAFQISRLLKAYCEMSYKRGAKPVRECGLASQHCNFITRTIWFTILHCCCRPTGQYSCLLEEFRTSQCTSTWRATVFPFKWTSKRPSYLPLLCNLFFPPPSLRTQILLPPTRSMLIPSSMTQRRKWTACVDSYRSGETTASTVVLGKPHHSVSNK